jgi:hypothetical protein
VQPADFSMLSATFPAGTPFGELISKPVYALVTIDRNKVGLRKSLFATARDRHSEVGWAIAEPAHLTPYPVVASGVQLPHLAPQRLQPSGAAAACQHRDSVNVTDVAAIMGGSMERRSSRPSAFRRRIMAPVRGWAGRCLPGP